MDVGGTRSRAILWCRGEGELRGDESRLVEGPGANPNRVGTQTTSKTIAALVNELNIADNTVDKLVIGLAGYSHADSFEAVRNGIKQSGLAIDETKAWLMSDAELAHIAAFGCDTEDCDGILLIAGTGSIALARLSTDGISQSPSIIRAGGHGYQNGDEGSGHWIGLQLQKLQAMNRDIQLALLDRLSMTAEDLANTEPSLLSITIDDLSSSHELVRNIARDAGAHLAALCLELKKKKKELRRVKVWGSVLKNSKEVQKHFYTALLDCGLVHDGEVVDVLEDCAAPLMAVSVFPAEGMFLLSDRLNNTMVNE